MPPVEVDLNWSGDLRAQYSFEARLKKKLSDLGLSGFEACRYYSSWNYALTEVIRSLMAVFSHKRSAMGVTGAGPTGLSTFTNLGREGFSVSFLEKSALLNSSSEAGLIPFDSDKWKKDVLFCFWDGTDPVTGETYYLPEFATFLSSKKIFSIRVVHSLDQFCRLKPTADPYQGWIVSLGAGGAFTQLGSRFRLEDLVFGNPAGFRWPDLKNLMLSESGTGFSDGIIQELNSVLPKEFKHSKIPAPAAGGVSLALHTEGCDADALVELGLRERALDWKDSDYLVLRPQDWNIQNPYAYLSAKGWTNDEIRSTLILRASLVERISKSHGGLRDLFVHLRQLRSRVLSLQDGQEHPI